MYSLNRRTKSVSPTRKAKRLIARKPKRFTALAMRTMAANAVPSAITNEPSLSKCTCCNTTRRTALCLIASGSASAVKNGSTAAMPPTVDKAITTESSCRHTSWRRCRWSRRRQSASNTDMVPSGQRCPSRSSTVFPHDRRQPSGHVKVGENFCDTYPPGCALPREAPAVGEGSPSGVATTRSSTGGGERRSVACARIAHGSTLGRARYQSLYPLQHPVLCFKGTDSAAAEMVVVAAHASERLPEHADLGQHGES